MNKITFDIGGKVIELIFKEVRELKRELDKLFDRKMIFHNVDYDTDWTFKLQPIHIENEKWDGKEIITNNHIQVSEANRWTDAKVYDDKFCKRQLDRDNLKPSRNPF